MVNNIDKNSVKERLHEIINGAIIGGAQVIVGHPFDTMKVIRQNGTIDTPKTTGIQSIYNRYGFQSIKCMYKGVKYPALTSCGYSAGCFGLYTWGIDVLGWSPFISGGISGVVMGATLTPFEYYKIQKQLGYCRRIGIPYWNRQEWQRWRPSIGVTMIREGSASAIYFSIYEWLYANRPFSGHELTGRYLDNNFVNGGLAGCASWLLTYPIDTIKTRQQSLSISEWRNTGWRKLLNDRSGLYKGVGICLGRAFLVNGVTFWLYEKLHTRPSVDDC